MYIVRAMSRDLAARYDVPFFALSGTLGLVPAIMATMHFITGGTAGPFFWAALVPASVVTALGAWVVAMQSRAYKALMSGELDPESVDAPRMDRIIIPLQITFAILAAGILGFSTVM